LFIIVGLASPAVAIDLGIEFTRHMKEGVAAYESGDYKQARESFRAAQLLRPQSPEAKMNLGLANARLAEREAAASAFREVVEMSAEERERLAEAHYNRGRNQLDRANELAGAEEPKYEEALAAALEGLVHFDRAREVKPEYKDAEFNYAQLQHLIQDIALKQMQQQQQQQQQQDQQNQDQQQDQQEQQDGSGSNDQQQDQQEGDQQQEPQDGQQQQDSQQQSGDQQQSNQEEQQPTGQPNQNPQQQENEEQQQQPQGQPSEQQEEQEQSGQEQQQPGEQQETDPGAMTKQQARNLLNMLGNPDVLKFRTPNRGGKRKEW